MPSQYKDPNLMLLYQCILSIGTKKIDFKEVGKALGVNAAAARMRYIRLEARMKSVGMIKSRVTSTGIVRPATKSTVPKSKLRKVTLRPQKRNKSARSESEGAVSSDDGEASEMYVGFKVEDDELTTGPRTRGVKIDVKDAFESDSSAENDTDASVDEYDANADTDEDGHDEDMSDTEHAKKSRNRIKQSIRQFRRSSTPPLTPGRFARTTNPTVSPLTPPSSQGKALDTMSTRVIPTTRYDKQVKQAFSALTPGMMLSLGNSASVSTTSRAISGANNIPYVKESDILESIERDDMEELADKEGEDEEMDEEDGEEGDKDAVGEDLVESSAKPVSKKSGTYPGGCATQ